MTAVTVANQKALDLIGEIEAYDGKKFDRQEAFGLMRKLVEAGFVRNKRKEHAQLMNVVFQRSDEYRDDMSHIYERTVSIAKDVFRHVDGAPTFAVDVTSKELTTAFLEGDVEIDMWKKRNDPGYEYTKTSPVPGDSHRQHVYKNTHWRDRCRSMTD